MVVLSVSVLSKGSGKIMIARQFVEMGRMRLEGLLTAFPKLIGTGESNEHRQHTYIDTNSVRYVYQPLDNYFLLLITNKTSNVVEDLHTLQLLSKVIPDVCGRLNEESIQSKQFELIFALDEILTAGGHSEHVNLQQIQTNLEMESHEEKLHNMILKSKRDAAKSEMKRQQQRIKGEQKERLRMERALGGPAGSSQGFGSSSSSSSSMNAPGNSNIPDLSTPYPSHPPAPSPLKNTAGGMKLGGAKKGKHFLDAMVAEDNLNDLPPVNTLAPPTSSGSSSSAPPVVPESSDPIVASIEEKISVILTRDGSVEQMEVKGTLFVGANDPDSAKCRLQLKMNNPMSISYQTHPKVDKKLFESSCLLGLKDPKKPFPVTRVGVLRWGIKTTDESSLPLNITCWPEEEGDGKVNVNLEYTLEREDSMALKQVNILMPLGTLDPPEILNIDGEYRHNPREGTLLWHLDSITSENATGSLEFSIRSQDVDAFFPIHVSFYAHTPFSDLEIEQVQTIEGATPVTFAFNKLLTSDNYVVQ